MNSMNSLSRIAFESESSTSKALDSKVIELLEKVASISQEYGHSVDAYTQKALSKLASLPIEKKEDLIRKLQNTINIAAGSIEIEKDGHVEKRHVEQALEMYGFELRDQDFWKKVGKDELIEMYNTENIQIFRTFNFFATSSYSILDLLTYEWYSLWERPSGTFESMFKVVGAIFSGEVKGPVSAEVPEHVISEIFNSADQEHFISRSSLCKFGIICPIYNKVDGQIAGLLVTARVTPLVTGEQAKSISFI